jgi:hypothetical protein
MHDRFYMLLRRHSLSGELLWTTYFFEEEEALTTMDECVQADATPTDYVLFEPGGRLIQASTWHGRNNLAQALD